MSAEKFAIRFGLGGIKAVGSAVMEAAVREREENGKFKDVYDFATRLDPRSVNKKSIEALAKSGGFSSIASNRRQVAESFEILSNYAVEKQDEASSNQMSLFGGIAEMNKKPELKKIEDWTKIERLQKEFEAFGFFLNEHPVDDFLPALKKRGVIFSDKLERDELEDNNLVKMAGVVAGSKHRSSARGRFAYLSVSDPFGIFEAMIFDEAIITNARDILLDGTSIALECLIKKDEGGVRILVRDVKKLDDFIKNTKAAEKDFEDIKKQAVRQNRGNWQGGNQNGNNNRGNFTPKQAEPKIEEAPKPLKNVFAEVKITISNRDQIFNLKSFLVGRPAPLNSEKSTKVFFTIDGKEIELPGKYFLDESDCTKLRNMSSEVKVSSS